MALTGFATLVVCGAAVYERLPAPVPMTLPFAPPRVPPSFERRASLPASPGALEGRSVLLVTLDTTRPDRLGCYGHDAIATPHLDGLAERGVLFENAVATASSTLPTHASLLTGRYPHRHGAVANSLFSLAERELTLAEILSERGYSTAAFVSAFVLARRFGLDQGFDTYDDETDATHTAFGVPERSADQTTDRAIEWLADAARAADPFFLWVHYYDPHAAYAPPPAYAATAENAYDGEIAFVDAQLGRLLEAARQRGGEDMLVVVTADHGESLGEHGDATHGYLVQEATLRIPLVLSAPGSLPAAVAVTTRASQVDLLPTVLALLGIDDHASAGWLDGIDLAKPPDSGRAVLAESLEGRTNFGWSRLSALYWDDHKLVEGARRSLYDLRRDPTEREDLADDEPGLTTELHWRLGVTRGAEPTLLEPSLIGLSTPERRRLEALGYIVGGGLVLPARGPGPDPRDWIGLLDRLHLIVSLGERRTPRPILQRLALGREGLPAPRSTEDVIDELEAVVAERPDFAPAHLFLGQLYPRVDRPRDAARATERLRRLLELAAASAAPTAGHP